MSEQTIEMIMEGLEYDGTLDKLENTLTDSSNLWQDVEDEMTEMLTDSLKTLLNSRRL